MVKFSKDLEAQLIPEWKDAFVNYWQLKKHVKKIKLSRKSPKQTQDPNGDFGLSIFDPIRFVVNKISNRLRNTGDKPEIIQVKSKVTEREDDEEVGEVYETELSQLFSEEDELKVFFERLDEELNKVNQFYKTKESEFLGRGEILNKQLQTLLERRQILSDRRRKSLSLAGFFSPSYSSSARNSDYSENPTEYNESPKEPSQEDDATASPTKTNEENTKRGMRVDIPASTPARTISSVTSTLREDIVLKKPKKEGQGDLITRKKTQCDEKKIRGAFVELYRGLGLLKTYSSLNMEAFIKILKKFDKVSNQQASASYLQVVKRSLFISSDKVVRLMDEVESLFTKHFANNDRKQAMKFLRTKHHKESHMVTFFVGLFTGCFVTLFSVYGILAHLCGMFSPATESAYMETVYPVFSMFALLSLHLFMYGCNLFMWKSTRINCNFIFEFQHSTALKYRDAFLICTSLMTAVVAAMVIHLVLLSNGFLPCQVDAIPGILLLSFITLLICPLNIFYRPTRYCFLRVIRNIVCSPFYKVLMVDFFMADQLTSQCARRWFDECDVNHLANLGKYVSAMVAAGARITYARQPTQLWMVIVLVTSLVATVYQLYWDFVQDWGIFNPKSKNPWLRDDLILKNKSIYYVSIALNFVLRVAWVETVMRFNIGVFESRLLEFFLASLEVIRRGHWNFYRLENKHLNNVGKFRAVKAVPLPFREKDSDG
ncbi:phosphate transporter PHO1-like isoform X2 [Actinidia eriantha]|uniref:phosphate transporter PHO1-like isoform X2 n=1 Tax=Actinidia eriantha TaxID=165200 RepID=UPI002590144E|nr:phosphate transporter PHO1-like isoform X2 [Actinidia eriantha]